MNELGQQTPGTGRGVIYTFLKLLILGLACLAIWAVGNYCLGRFGAPTIAATIWTIIFLLVGLIIFIDFLMGLIGRSFLNL